MQFTEINFIYPDVFEAICVIYNGDSTYTL